MLGRLSWLYVARTGDMLGPNGWEVNHLQIVSTFGLNKEEVACFAIRTFDIDGKANSAGRYVNLKVQMKFIKFLSVTGQREHENRNGK